MNNTNVDYYEIAYKEGKKELRRRAMEGQSTKMLVLDEILAGKNIGNQLPLGVKDISLDRVVGTKTSGREPAFTPDFLPVMEPGSEFSFKYTNLVNAHLNEGIRDAITAYEYMHNYYVQEGNKRVSVLKLFKSATVRASVIRILPERDGSPESNAYYEFLDFYADTGLAEPVFNQEGAYALLYEELGYAVGERWKKEDVLDLKSSYDCFYSAFRELQLDHTGVEPGDAMRHYVEVYGYIGMPELSQSDLKDRLRMTINDMQGVKEGDEPILVMDPTAEDAAPVEKKGLFRRSAPKKKTISKVAFIYQGTPETFAWTFAHEKGRQSLELEMEQLQTAAYQGATKENVLELIGQAIADGNEVIFVTSPLFLTESVQASLENPNVQIFNCSLDASHTQLPTYYGRIFEVHMLLGMLAGTLTKNDHIVYIADIPLLGIGTNINAFARGVKLVRPQAKVHLIWSQKEGMDDAAVGQAIQESGADVVADMDMSNAVNPRFGLSTAEQGVICHPTWYWHSYYKKIVASLQSAGAQKETRAASYWWGLSAGVVGINWMQEPTGEQSVLLKLAEEGLAKYVLSPFDGVMMDTDGNKHEWTIDSLNVKDVISMNWLLDNVEGEIPQSEEMKEEFRYIVGHGGLMG